MRRHTVVLWTIVLVELNSSAFAQSPERNGGSQAETKSATRTPAIGNPVLFLIRDPAIQSDLQLRDDQKKAVRMALDELDGPIWLLRDVGAEEGKGRADALIAKGNSSLAGILNSTQQKRLDQIVLQSQGPEALFLPGIAQKLALSNEQRQQVRETIDARQEDLHELLTKAAANKDPEKVKDFEQQAVKIRAAEHEQLLIILTDSQKRQWSAMLGKPIDLSRVLMSRIKAPEIVSPDEWINSEPLSIDKLRGRVVALHFWTFGCINCVRNYPWYKQWHEDYADKGLTVLGIHTPEGESEKEADSVRKKVEENGMLYPIAIDSQARTWKAWSNAWWPATYLIDKNGYVRYWWYGELNWEGKEGEKFMRSKIEELLAEKQ